MSVTRKVLNLAAHDMPADVRSGLYSIADAVAELGRDLEAARTTQLSPPPTIEGARL